MKKWNAPVVEELNVKATAYDPQGGVKEDGKYISVDGKYVKATYGPSTNSGEPFVEVH